MNLQTAQPIHYQQIPTIQYTIIQRAQLQHKVFICYSFTQKKYTIIYEGFILYFLFVFLLLSHNVSFTCKK